MAEMVWKSEEEAFLLQKSEKKETLSQICQERIEGYFESTVRGNTYLFSYDRESQLNFQERFHLFQNNMVEKITLTAHTHDGEDLRLDVNKDEFEQVYMDSVLHKKNLINHLRDTLYPMVDSAKSSEELDSIQFDLELLYPEPTSIDIDYETTLDREIDRLELSSAVSNTEMMNIILMSQFAGNYGTASLLSDKEDN